CHFLPVVIAAACFLLGFTCCIVLKSSIISMGKHHILTQINTLQRLSFANKQKVLTDTMDDFGAHISPAKETKAILFTDKHVWHQTQNGCSPNCPVKCCQKS
ncbi:hypothetical protein AABB24_005097, partial [Solanum stoloniferum]